MLKLTYTKKRDRFQEVTVLGDPEGIRDLYWQLTANHVCKDWTGIEIVIVTNLDGHDCTAEIMARPYAHETVLSDLRG